MRNVLRHALTVVVLLLLVACPDPGEETAEQPGGSTGEVAALAAYVLLAPAQPGTPSPVAVAVARVIVDGASAACPSLTGGSQPIATVARANPDPIDFPVTVCEAQLSLPSPELAAGGLTLPAAALDPATLVVFGDTGCHHSTCGSTGPSTQFATLAGIAAGLSPAPGVVLHVGDYNYRGTSSHVPLASDPSKTLTVYDAGDDAAGDPDCQLTSPYVSQNADYSGNPDQWINWWYDFFEPAAPLLATAPFVFARGNHELCSRAGIGWFYFLDPSGPATGADQLSCPPQGLTAGQGQAADANGSSGPPLPPDATGRIITRPTYSLDLGTLNVAVLDSANACDANAPFADSCGGSAEYPVCIYQQQLEQLLGSVPAAKPTWLMTHRPTWGAEKPENGDCADSDWEGINVTLQKALSLAGPTLSPTAELFVSGHMHRFQSLAFTAGTRPAQMVIGDSGVELDSEPSCTFSTTLGGETVAGLELQQFGFLHVTSLAADGSWSGELIGTSSTLACCNSASLPASICTQGACS